MVRLSETRARMPFRSRRIPVDARSLQSAATAFYRPVDVHLSFSRGLQCQLCDGPSLSSRSIGKPLTDHAAQKIVSALRIVDANGDAIAEPEIELGDVALQV